VKIARGGKGAGGCPSSGGWIVEFRAGERGAAAVNPPSNEHLPARQQRRGVKSARCGERTRACERAGPTSRRDQQENQDAPQQGKPGDMGRVTYGKESEECFHAGMDWKVGLV